MHVFQEVSQILGWIGFGAGSVTYLVRRFWPDKPPRAPKPPARYIPPPIPPPDDWTDEDGKPW